MCLFDIEMLFFDTNKSHVYTAFNNTTSLYTKETRKQSNCLYWLKMMALKDLWTFFSVKVNPDKIWLRWGLILSLFQFKSRKMYIG